MKVVVLVAGVADPKWPLGTVQRAPKGGVTDREARILSPFDEASLELALKLRDRDAATEIVIALCEPVVAEGLARSLLAYRPTALVRVDVSAVPLWDAVAAGRALCDTVLAHAASPDLILMGREFGDLDDGALPPALAERLGFRFHALVQAVEDVDGAVHFVRERGGIEELLALEGPMLASVTNDRRNRLRHPLFKNVVAAKRAALNEPVSPRATGAPAVAVEAIAPAGAKAREARCRMLVGTADEQANALAAHLRAIVAEP